MCAPKGQIPKACGRSPFHRFFETGGIVLLGLSLTGANVKPETLLMQEAVMYQEEGRRFQEAGQLERALTAYQKAVAINPHYSDAYNDLGVVLENLGDVAHAEEAYQAALRLNPLLASAHSNLALLYERTGKVKEATDHWSARVLMGPPDSGWVLKAKERLIQHQFPIPKLPAEVARGHRMEVSLAYEAGLAHLEMGRQQQAIEEFQRVLALDPTHRRAAQHLRQLRRAEMPGRKREGWKRAGLSGVQGPTARFPIHSPSRGAKPETVVKGVREQKGPPVLFPPPRFSKGVEPQAVVKIAEERRRKSVFLPPSPKDVEKTKVPVSLQGPMAPETVAQAFAVEKVRLRKETIQELLARGETAMRQGLYAKAVTAFQEVLILDPKHPKASQGLQRAKASLAKASMAGTLSPPASFVSERSETKVAGMRSPEGPRAPKAAPSSEGAMKPPAPAVPGPDRVEVKAPAKRPEDRRSQVPSPASTLKEEKPRYAGPFPIEARGKPVVPGIAGRTEPQRIEEAVARDKAQARRELIREEFTRGVTAMRQGLYKEAIAHFQQVLVLDPANPQAGQAFERAQAAQANASRVTQIRP
jgi:tetratricopeptide (TPR) repeat protein